MCESNSVLFSQWSLSSLLLLPQWNLKGSIKFDLLRLRTKSFHCAFALLLLVTLRSGDEIVTGWTHMNLKWQYNSSSLCTNDLEDKDMKEQEGTYSSDLLPFRRLFTFGQRVILSRLGVGVSGGRGEIQTQRVYHKFCVKKKTTVDLKWQMWTKKPG